MISWFAGRPGANIAPRASCADAPHRAAFRFPLPCLYSSLPDAMPSEYFLEFDWFAIESLRDESSDNGGDALTWGCYAGIASETLYRSLARRLFAVPAARHQ